MKSTANLQNSAKEGVDFTDVPFLPTGYEPNAHDFYETTAVGALVPATVVKATGRKKNDRWRVSREQDF